jgi:hypothetical protein
MDSSVTIIVLPRLWFAACGKDGGCNSTIDIRESVTQIADANIHLVVVETVLNPPRLRVYAAAHSVANSCTIAGRGIEFDAGSAT